MYLHWAVSMVIIISKSASEIINGFESVPPCVVTEELPPQFSLKR